MDVGYAVSKNLNSMVFFIKELFQRMMLLKYSGHMWLWFPCVMLFCSLVVWQIIVLVGELISPVYIFKKLQ